jgi:hypothetical protein
MSVHVGMKSVLDMTMDGAMQLTLSEGAVEHWEDSPIQPPMWILIFRDGLCLYRNEKGDILPAMALPQILFSYTGLDLSHYDAEPPFDAHFSRSGVPGWGGPGKPD